MIQMKSLNRKKLSKQYLKEYLIEQGLFSISLILILIISLLMIFVMAEAIPAFNNQGWANFIFGLNWNPDSNEFGVFPMILGTVYVTVLSLAMAIPLAISCAIFLEEICPNNIRKLFKPIIQTLAGIPSVIYGFFGLTLIVPIIRSIFGGSGFSILTSSIILALMVLPTIITLTQDSLKAVPNHYKEASLGMGATQFQTIKSILLPIALPGIVTAVILALARAVGETLAVLMLAGNVSMFPSSIASPIRTLTSNIALEMGYATDIHYNALFASAVVLFILILVLMLISSYVQKRYALREAYE